MNADLVAEGVNTSFEYALPVHVERQRDWRRKHPPLRE